MPLELYEQVKDDIPKHIGVWNWDGRWGLKRPKRQELKVDEQILKDSLIRSLYREAEKVIKSENPNVVEQLNRQYRQAKKEAEEYREKYWRLMRIGEEKYGTRWYKEGSL